MINIGLYKKSMEVGYLFWNKYKNDERVYEWNATVECSNFCESIIRLSNNTGKSINEVFFDTSEQIIETAYMVVICMFMVVLCAVIHWIC